MFSESSTAWIEYAEFETQLQEMDRARAIYELAIQRTSIDMPENVWKSYIDLEIGLGNHEKVRELYRRLISRTKHVKVWLSFAKFEQENAKDASNARGVYNEAYQHFK